MPLFHKAEDCHVQTDKERLLFLHILENKGYYSTI